MNLFYPKIATRGRRRRRSREKEASMVMNFF
jgi:hypothetical protein